MPPSPADGSPERARDGPDARDQAKTIARATFDGFLQSDLMPQGMQAPALIWAAAFLVGPAIFFPIKGMVKFGFIRAFHPHLLEATFWSDRLLFLVMSAGAMGIVSVVLWETLFPARRDAFVLTPLPVPLPVQMLGRLLGLATFCALFIVLLNGIPAIAFPVVTAGGFLEMPRGIVAHFASTTAADLFVFFGITSLQGLVILGFGRRVSARLASVAQAGTVLMVLLVLLFFGSVREITRDAIVRNDPQDLFLLFNPAAWFLGLYEFIAGSPRPIMGRLALLATLGAIVPMAMTAAVYAFGYQRLLKRAVETPSRSTRSLPVRAVSRVVRWTFVRRPEEQAVCAFLIRAISRSGRHSLLLSIYVGASLAAMITFVLPDVIRLGPAALATPTIAVLALPLVLSAGLAVGIRILMTIPAEMPARWVFQTSALSKWHVDAAAHKALLLLVLPPVMLTAAATAGTLWSVELGWLHAIYCGSLALLLCEALLLGFRGVPLTRPYVPGGSRFHMLWAAYISIFLTYTLTSAQIERSVYASSGRQGVLIAAAVFTGFAFVFWGWRKIKLRSVEAVAFEADVPDDETFQGFNLTEIYAAQAVAAHGASQRANGAPKHPV